MRMKFIACSLLLVLGSCNSNAALGTMSEADNNVTNLSRISLGMTKSEVFSIMKYPYSQKTVMIDTDTYEIWFYITTPTALGQSAMTTTNLTPLTFKNGVLVGTGRDYYRWVIKEHKASFDDQLNRPADTKVRTEDTELEKALDQNNKPLSMSAKPKKETPEPEDNPPEKKKKPPLNKDDGQMIEMEGEQNFDFW